MPDVEDFDNFFGGAVHNHVRLTDKLAGSKYFSGAAEAGEGGQLLDPVNNSLSEIPCSGGIVLLDIPNGGFKFVSRFGCPPNSSHA